MRLTIDLTTLAVTSTSTLLTRRKTSLIEVLFTRLGVQAEIDSSAEGAVALTVAGTLVAGGGATSWTKSGSGLSALYTFSLDCNTEAVEALFSSQSKPVAAILTIDWTIGGVPFESAPLPVSINTANFTGTESDPSALPDLKASQSEAEAGTDNTKWMTPERTAQAIAARGGSGGSSSFTLMNDSNLDSGWFTAVAGGKYAVDTTTAPAFCQLPASPSVGDTIEFSDAKGTWNSHSFTIDRNGKKIEGFEVNYADTAQGTEFFIVYIDDTTGWKIYESGTKPHIIVAPTTPTGGSIVGSVLTANNGTWTGSPTGYTYQWQNSPDGTTWTPISGATSSTYTLQSSDNGLYVSVLVTASNSNGASLPSQSGATAVVTTLSFPSGTIASWPLNDAGTWADATGHGNTLTQIGSVTNTLDSGMTVASFAGGGAGYLSLPAGLMDLAGGSKTASLWFKPTGDNGTYNTIFGQGGTDGTGYSPCQVVGFGASATVNTYTSYSGWGWQNWWPQLENIPIGSWTRICISFDATTGTFKRYLNGALIKTGTFTPPRDNGSSYALGSYPSAGASFDFIGEIAQVDVFNRAISDDEETILWNNGSPLAYH